MMSSSTLVETVSINYDDFNESFLTCSTCLSMYDGVAHTPKLLPCSHTVCRSCLESIVEAIRPDRQDGGSFRCPICRESIQLPQGGVHAFPPSFLVNQLLDLMARQRREIVPKCPVHMSQELLFCESCDTIFCIMCAGAAHGGNHTVIPFSIAIKRMSEILLYKAHSCVQNLNAAQDKVTTELTKLEESTSLALECISQSFDVLQALIAKRKQELVSNVGNIQNSKKKIFREQLQLIEAEKGRVQNDCQGLESEMEVRHITKKIADLNERLDATSVLAEPRENAYIHYSWKEQIDNIVSLVTHFGKIKTSTTFPALCQLELGSAITFLTSTATLCTVDYHGRSRTTGSDPVEVDLKDPGGEPLQFDFQDMNNGTYSISYMPTQQGKHQLSITIFNRHIRNSPFQIEVTEHISPISKTGSKGNGLLDFSQPTSITRDDCGHLYILDTGNNRIKVLAPDGSFMGHLTPDGLEKQGCTGIAMTPSGTIMAINWRTKLITELHVDGRVIKQFTSPELAQPTCIAVNSKNDVIVADNTAGCLFVFDNTGRLINKLGQLEWKFELVAGLATAPNDDIIVADNRLLVFGSSGEFKHELTSPSPRQKGSQYGGVTVDMYGNILASRTERGRSFVEVHRLQDNLVFFIDSFSDRLKRPAGLVTTDDFSVYVCDLGNHVLKRYLYK